MEATGDRRLDMHTDLNLTLVSALWEFTRSCSGRYRTLSLSLKLSSRFEST